MSERHARTERDRRRRSLGQNFLADPELVARFVDGLGVAPGDLVVDVGAGAGALTTVLSRTGAEIWAVETDPAWVARLRAVTSRDPNVRVIGTDIRRLRLPARPYRVVANPPFGMTTDLLSLLLDEPERGPSRADLILQHDVVRKHAATPPVALRTAAWAPWWEFSVGMKVSRSSFRPRPSVDASVLTIRRRTPPVLPNRLAPGFADTLRPAWVRH
ncbi:MAG: rRNA adenine N(6)-methyltransferase family protein [Ilumatobacteraceae bacterium]